MKLAKVALLVSPGWTLHAGGPHIALPTIKNFLSASGIESKVFDFNIECSSFLGSHISEEEALTASTISTLSSLNKIYFNAEGVLSNVASQYSGNWNAHEGFCFFNCDLSNPDHIKEYSCKHSPYTEFFKNLAIHRLEAFNPEVIGFNIVVPSQLLSAFELIRLLRKFGYSGKILIGGNTISRIAEEMRLDWVFDLIDGLVVLQGEKTILEYCRCLSSGDDFSKVPNLIWRNSKGMFCINKTETLELKNFVGPDFTDLPIGNYWGANYLTVMGSRGCYYGKCSFCAIPHGWGKSRFLGNASALAVFHDMEQAVSKFGINRFKFIEEALHPKFLKDLCSIIVDRKLKIEFEGYIRFDKAWLDEDFLSLCSEAGLRRGLLGLELAPSETRDSLCKNDQADPIALLKKFSCYGIKTHIFCLFGFPGTGVKEAVNTVKFALAQQDLIDTLDIFPFYYARHTNVAGVEIIPDQKKTWAVEWKYRPLAGILSSQQVNIMVEKMQDIIWRERPEWFHPVYRMVTSWYSKKEFDSNMAWDIRSISP